MSVLSAIMTPIWRIERDVVRRPAAIVGGFAWIIVQVGFWLLVPALIVGYIAYKACRGFWRGCCGAAEATIASVRAEPSEWAAFGRGFGKVWATSFAQRPVARLVTRKPNAKATPAEDAA